MESILTGLDHPDELSSPPETPPTRDQSKEWFSPSGSSAPFSSKPSWSFSETETTSSLYQRSSEKQPAYTETSVSGHSMVDRDSIPEEPIGSCSDGGGCTTVMLRNIPNKYTRSGLLSALVERGFDPTGDCNNLYLPMDASSGCNLGYAFLNFTTHEKALGFMKQFDGCRLPSAGSRKVCTVVWANKQGLFQHSNPPTSREQTIPGNLDQMTLDGVPTCKVFVGGLTTNTTEADLVEYFGNFGEVREASIVINRQTGSSRGFGFCEFTSPDSVDRVQVAQARKPHSINCRVVSVRPYNSCTQAGFEFAAPPITSQPATMTFLMGNGMIHCPQTVETMPPHSYSTFGATSGTYSHPLLGSPSLGGVNGAGYVAPQFHSFMSY